MKHQAPTVPGMHNLFLLSQAKSRSISPENPSGGKGMGGQTELEKGSARKAAKNLGKGWKVNPYVLIKPGEEFIMGETTGPGVINHIWMTMAHHPVPENYRAAMFRIYWDDAEQASVESPVGDFFATTWGMNNEPVIDSHAIVVNPKSGFNSFWQMPFRKKFRMTMQNTSDQILVLYYQINYSLTDVPENAAYFHAQFRMVNPLGHKEVFTILDGVKGQGHYVGTYLAHAAFSPGWWGEGEVKFYLDGDQEYPTINTTGEEDYFLGSYCYAKKDVDGIREEVNYSGAYAGFYATKIHELAGDYMAADAERRHGQYRWHVMDPIRFESEIKVTIQCLGWKDASLEHPLGPNREYLSLKDHLASVAYWYQTLPCEPFPKLPGKKDLTIPAEK
jgi:hypothetical protein